MFKSTSMSMFHHQSQRKLSFNVQSQSLQPKNTTKSSSLRLHLLHNTKLQSSQLNHKTKKRPSFTFWSRNQKPHKTLLSQLPSQLNQANQKFTSSNTRHKKKLPLLDLQLVDQLEDSHQVDHLDSHRVDHLDSHQVDQLVDIHQEVQFHLESLTTKHQLQLHNMDHQPIKNKSTTNDVITQKILHDFNIDPY